ncbi:hypothetical protein OPV22_020584 [Ensete ventricosum]|uniref:Uncharacterized protein n=1 Tax=Ensete ventricosum TaxID=4639 RepID=A0AAV8QNP1_ENSVE|nr:hypothetical protein OPV22_020584 [Ensete ventricosum]
MLGCVQGPVDLVHRCLEFERVVQVAALRLPVIRCPPGCQGMADEADDGSELMPIEERAGGLVSVSRRLQLDRGCGRPRRWRKSGSVHTKQQEAELDIRHKFQDTERDEATR